MATFRHDPDIGLGFLPMYLPRSFLIMDFPIVSFRQEGFVHVAGDLHRKGRLDARHVGERTLSPLT